MHVSPCRPRHPLLTLESQVEILLSKADWAELGLPVLSYTYLTSVLLEGYAFPFMSLCAPPSFPSFSMQFMGLKYLG